MEKTAELIKQITERLNRRPARIDKADRLWDAAVLVPLIDTKQGPAVLFEVRAAGLGWQPGDVCFPGGRYECGDDSFAKTAVRETCEELGITEDKIELCGELDYLVTHMGPIIHPFVGRLANEVKLDCNSDEVAEIFTVPLNFLLVSEPRVAHMELANRATADFPFDLLPRHPHDWYKRKGYNIYFYEYQGHVIWGLKARILHGFIKRFHKELQANIL